MLILALCYYDQPVKLASRLATLAWTLTVLIIMSAYQGSLTVFLIEERIAPASIESVEALIAAQVTY